MLFVSAPTMEALGAIRPVQMGADSLFGLSAEQIGRRISSAAAVVGLGEGFTVHSARVGMAQDLARSGAELPALMTAGLWQSPTMPARYTRAEQAGEGRSQDFMTRIELFGRIQKMKCADFKASRCLDDVVDQGVP